jgi:hypothetical protein
MVLMMTRHTEHAQRIRDELTCPACRYSLRGLPGEVVLCPECGLKCDITAMMTRQWTGPWYNAPGFNRLLGPLVWLCLFGFAGLVLVGFSIDRSNPFVAVSAFLVVFGWWAYVLWRVRDVPTPGAGVPLALLAHGLFAGYLFGVGLLLMIIVRAINAGSLPGFVLITALMVAPIGIFWMMRRGEKYIAERCIRAWVNQAVENADAPDAIKRT